MFTVKLMKGVHNDQIKIIEAREVEIKMGACGSSIDGGFFLISPTTLSIALLMPP